MNTDINLRYFKSIVIGGSAGAIQGLKQLLQKLPEDFKPSITVVLHRNKNDYNLLEEVLANFSPLPVKQADEKEVIRGGQIYIAPPNYHLLIENDLSFSLSLAAAIHYCRPSIDVLFESAAREIGSNLLGVLLSGTNHDGASGLATIHRCSGTTVVQDPQEAEYDIMPAAAIATGEVDFILKINEIAKLLTKT